MSADTLKIEKHDECCDLMAFVLRRGHERESNRTGLRRETFFSLRGSKPPRESLVIYFPRGKKRSAPGADSIYAEVGFCPFCGAVLNENARTIQRARKRKSKKQGGSR